MVEHLLSDKQKAWAGFAIGVISQTVAIIAAVLMEGTAKTVLLATGAIVGTIGAGLGVYGVKNVALGTRIG